MNLIGYVLTCRAALPLLLEQGGGAIVNTSYVNHAGFWLVKESFGMDLTQAARTQVRQAGCGEEGDPFVGAALLEFVDQVGA
ncbi:hypothetical protein ADK57_40875 [Streptomyces sp. MMG1533]|uniref:hypothetical protein n=1 Tax=Streptomyces sp. MMG1533 TaxID=1415546 RepID=UPI0006AF02ED|nr:hypothetical protein [Streptomyces sp. MMG1533]KOU56783.1 hypothetical protein ADK57_40875 [Streptomyces sp. MMG1533]